MDLLRFKRLEDEVKQDLYNHIHRTRGVSDFKPQYLTAITRTTVRTQGTSGVKSTAASSIKGGSSKSSYTSQHITAVKPYDTNYSDAPTEEESEMYKMLSLHCSLQTPKETFIRFKNRRSMAWSGLRKKVKA